MRSKEYLQGYLYTEIFKSYEMCNYPSTPIMKILPIAMLWLTLRRNRRSSDRNGSNKYALYSNKISNNHFSERSNFRRVCLPRGFSHPPVPGWGLSRAEPGCLSAPGGAGWRVKQRSARTAPPLGWGGPGSGRAPAGPGGAHKDAHGRGGHARAARALPGHCAQPVPSLSLPFPTVCCPNSPS